MMALLLASPTLANAWVLSMSVSPNHAAVGVRTCFQLPALLTTLANRASPSEVPAAPPEGDPHALAIAEEQ